MKHNSDSVIPDMKEAVGWIENEYGFVADSLKKGIVEIELLRAGQEEAAIVIANLINTMSDWQRVNLNSVNAALEWLRKNDDPLFSLPCSVRDMMEELP